MGNPHPRLWSEIGPRQEAVGGHDGPKFYANPGNSSVSEIDTSRYLIANKNWPNVGTKHVSDVTDKRSRKSGIPIRDLGSGIGPRQIAVDRTRFSGILWKSRVIHLSPKMAIFRRLIAQKNGPHFGAETGPRREG